MAKTIIDWAKEMDELSTDLGWTRNELQRTIFVVNEKGEPMILRSKKYLDLTKMKHRLKELKIEPVVVYSGNFFTGVGLGYSSAAAFHNPKTRKYASDARIDKTNRDCIEMIIADCGGEITHI